MGCMDLRICNPQHTIVCQNVPSMLASAQATFHEDRDQAATLTLKYNRIGFIATFLSSIEPFRRMGIHDADCSAA
jgi:hypothetical protein